MGINTSVGISDRIVRRIPFAMLTLVPDKVKVSAEWLVEIEVKMGSMLLAYITMSICLIHFFIGLSHLGC